MDQAVDERDHAGGVGEHLGPFGKGLVGGDEGALFLVATADELEEQIGVALNALTSSFNEASRWLNSQRDLLGVLELNEQQSLPRYVLQEGGKPLAREAVKH